MALQQSCKDLIRQLCIVNRGLIANNPLTIYRSQLTTHYDIEILFSRSKAGRFAQRRRGAQAHRKAGCKKKKARDRPIKVADR